jgi:four helix bundle protein
MDEQAYLFNFEKLEVWQDARKFISEVYLFTDKFPKNEKFGLTSQIQRAVVSVAANIAEGSSRFSRKDFARYVQISFGSLMEVLSHSYVAYDQKYIKREELQDIRKQIKKISNKLNSLYRSLSDRD